MCLKRFRRKSNRDSHTFLHSKQLQTGTLHTRSVYEYGRETFKYIPANSYTHPQFSIHLTSETHLSWRVDKSSVCFVNKTNTSSLSHRLRHLSFYYRCNAHSISTNTHPTCSKFISILVLMIYDFFYLTVCKTTNACKTVDWVTTKDIIRNV